MAVRGAGAARMIGPWYPPSWPTRRSSPPSERCCRRRARASTSTPAAPGRCRPRRSGRWTSRRARELAVGRASGDQFAMVLERHGGGCGRRSPPSSVADPDDIAITHSTTDGMNLAINALAVAAGRPRSSRPATSTPAALGPLLAPARAASAIEVELRRRRRRRRRRGDARGLRRGAHGPARGSWSSRHVLWTTGARPAGRADRRASPMRAGAVTIVDGAQAAGAIPVSVEELGVDFYAVPGQKWLLGPEGMGALWARRDWARERDPGLGRLLQLRDAGPAGAASCGPTPAGSRSAFFHRPSIIGLARSCGWLSMYVGLPWSQDAGRALARAAADRLARDRRASTLLTPRDRMATLVTFRIAGWPAAARRRRARRADVRDRPDLAGRRRAADQRRLLQHRGGARAVRRGRGAARRPHARDDPAAAHACRPRLGRQPDPVSAPPSTVPVRGPRSATAAFFEVRWRQFRHAPRPVVRAVMSSLVVALVLGVVVSSPTTSRSTAAPRCPGGDLRLAFLVVYVLAVARRRRGRDVPRRAAAVAAPAARAPRAPRGALALGLFAAVPIAYLVLVALDQILKPLLT